MLILGFECPVCDRDPGQTLIMRLFLKGGNFLHALIDHEERRCLHASDRKGTFFDPGLLERNGIESAQVHANQPVGDFPALGLDVGRIGIFLVQQFAEPATDFIGF
ncbi:hypothetical protein SDC9_172362 [bioreactor metagenome]|uniref:Uncharacterized protein n=1 Tax=bioreactor metagenome TaxID=1076179 RepID=A0A645GFL4_9ZZZZ